ncbi:tetratricopeptide repeat protein [bacterium]|nr:tetratricopeptide repeat protein [bacterium]
MVKLGNRQSKMKADAKAYEEELKRKITEKEKDPKIGANHPETAVLLTRLGSLYTSMAKWKEAAQVLERSLDVISLQLKADHPQIPLTLGLLADVYMKLDKPSDIEFRFNQYDKKAVLDVGVEHPLVGEIKYNLGSFYRVRSRYPESRQSYEASLDIWYKRLRPDHPRMVSAYTELSGVCRILGMNEMAEKLLKKLIKLRAKTLGEEHLKVGEHWKDLGLFYKNIGKPKEAEGALQKALDILAKGLGKQSPLLSYLRKAVADVQKEIAAETAARTAETAAAESKETAKPPGG